MKVLVIITFISAFNVLCLCLFFENTKIGNAIQNKIIEKIKGGNNE